MGMVSWLNRTFQTTFLSAPQVAMAGGAEGVSVVHPIEAGGSKAVEESVPSEASLPGDAPATAPEEKSSVRFSVADDMKASIAQYGAESGAYDYDDYKDGIGSIVEEAPIVRLANTIVQQAIKERASDIHIEPEKRQMRVRYRIDGVLHEAMPMPKYLQIPLTNRYKVMAEIDMATHRGLPQEGRLPIRYEGVDYNICVNSHPARYGEYLTFHIHSAERLKGGYDALGISPKIQEPLEWLLSRPCGLLLMVGPAGSGTTTTQYALLNHLNTVGMHGATVEERETYSLHGLTQIVVNANRGESFAGAIRGVLRQDVDVLGIGDIQDKKTAQAALEASASCLVLATMHGNDAISALVRLAALGIDPGLLASVVQGALTQRRVRRICTHCKETYEVANRELRRFGFNPEDAEGEVTIARGAGCDHCRRSGYLDCIGFYELFQWDATLINLFTTREALPRLKEVFAWNNRSDALRDDGLKKILAHLTTPEEALRML